MKDEAITTLFSGVTKTHTELKKNLNFQKGVTRQTLDQRVYNETFPYSRIFNCK